MESILNNLKSSDPATRNAAAIEFIDFVESAKVVILEQIQRTENRKARGTLLYALGHIQCTDSFIPVFTALLDGGFEVAMHAHEILETQHFELTEDEKTLARKLFEQYTAEPSSSSIDFEEERSQRIDDVMGWYVTPR